jgi:predicted membrane protein
MSNDISSKYWHFKFLACIYINKKTYLSNISIVCISNQVYSLTTSNFATVLLYVSDAKIVNHSSLMLWHKFTLSINGPQSFNPTWWKWLGFICPLTTQMLNCHLVNIQRECEVAKFTPLMSSIEICIRLL